MSQQTQQIVAACMALQTATSAADRAGADAFLQQFRRSPRPYDVCIGILRQSSEAAVHYHMLAVIKEAALREWTTLSPPEIQQLRDTVLDFVTAAAAAAGAGGGGGGGGGGGAAAQPAFVVTQALHVAAVLFKRQWLANDDVVCAAFSQRAQALASQPHTRITALRFVSAVVAEFASSSSTALGVSW
jgi:hypothetical protein